MFIKYSTKNDRLHKELLEKIRERMEKTGENYSTARRAIFAMILQNTSEDTDVF